MEFSDSIDFIEVKCHQNSIFTLALELQIETKKFPRFHKPFATGRYLNLAQWEEIIRTIEKVARSYMKDSGSGNSEGDFNTDEVNVAWKILPKENSYIRFEKLRFTYVLDFVVSARISRICYDRPITPDVIDIVSSQVPKTQVAEYEPNSVIASKPKSRYKPGSIEPSKDKKQIEYSPKSMTADFKIHKTYTPSKIDAVDDDVPSSVSPKQSKKMYELFGSEDENRESNPQVVQSSSDERKDDRRGDKKRTYASSESQKSSESSSQKRKKSKNDSSQSSLDGWMSRSKTPSRMTDKRSSKNKSTKKRNGIHPLHTFDEEEMEKMNNFVEKTRQDELDKVRRRDELETFDMLDCNDMNNDQLKRMVADFAPNIKNFYANNNLVNRSKNYNPVMLTTSNILTEAQMSFVCKEIEGQRDANDRGYNEDVLTEKILPEFIIHVFCEKYKLSKNEALERLKVQDERRALFDDTQLY